MDLIRRDQKQAAARTLAEAFWDDPLLQILEPDVGKRASVGAWFFGRAVEYGLRWGRVWGNDDASAVAIWLPPGSTELTPGRMLRVGFGALPFKVGLRGTARFARATAVTGRFHEAVGGPHWYLMAVGARSACQGRGLGTALVELGTSQAAAVGLPCYLETGTERNVDFYEKRGFEVTGRAEAEGFTLYGMVRPPR